MEFSDFWSYAWACLACVYIGALLATLLPDRTSAKLDKQDDRPIKEPSDEERMRIEVARSLLRSISVDVAALKILLSASNKKGED